MKRILATTTILALSAGFAAAEVTLSGDARMGIIGGDGVDTGFTSRARVKFSMSGESDGGMTFGASFRADNAGGAADGDSGDVYISGAFGKLSMGDVDGAAQQAVGNVDGVGLTGLGDLNETFYVHNFINSIFVDIDPTAAYEYSTGAFTGIISVSKPDALFEVHALGVKYATETFSVGLGYESLDLITFENLILGGSATFGAVTLKANYSVLNTTTLDYSSYHVSATYTADALAVTAFYSNEDDLFVAGGPSVGASGYGIGASYDLGGGASVVGGYASNESLDTTAFDLGLSFSF